MKNHLKTFLFLGAAFVSLPAVAQVSVDGSSLTVALGAGSYDIGITTGPVPGQVRLTGIPGIVDGATYFGIAAVNYSSGIGSDTVEIRQSGAVLPAISVRKAGRVNVDAFAEITSFDPVVSAISVAAGAGSSSVKNIIKSTSDSLTLNWRTVFGAGSSEVTQEIISDQPSSSLDGSVFVDLGAGASINQTILTTRAQNVDLDVRMDAGSTGELTFATTHARPGASSIASVDLSGAQKIQWNWSAEQTSLALTGVMRGSANSETHEAEIAANTTGTLSSLLGNGDDTSTITLKGASAVAGSMNGAGGNDALKLQIDGIQTGVMRLNGGLGIDFCSAPPPALRSGCEES